MSFSALFSYTNNKKLLYDHLLVREFRMIGNVGVNKVAAAENGGIINAIKDRVQFQSIIEKLKLQVRSI